MKEMKVGWKMYTQRRLEEYLKQHFRKNVKLLLVAFNNLDKNLLQREQLCKGTALAVSFNFASI